MRVFDLRPDAGVVLNLNVAAGEGAGEPGEARCGNVAVLIGEVDVVDDLRRLGIGGVQQRASVQQAFRLVEVDGLRDVGRNDGVVAKAFPHPVHLDDQEHGNVLALEMARYVHSLRSSPGVAVKDDTCGWVRRRRVCQQFEDMAVGVVAVVVLKDVSVDSGAVFLAQVAGQLDLAVDPAGALDKPSREADDDERSRRGGLERRGAKASLGDVRGRSEPRLLS